MGGIMVAPPPAINGIVAQQLRGNNIIGESLSGYPLWGTSHDALLHRCLLLLGGLHRKDGKRATPTLRDLIRIRL